MSFAVVATAGAAVAGGAMAARGAKGAAKEQAAATDRANAVTEAQFQQVRSDQAPYRTMGKLATNRLQEMLGLSNGGADYVHLDANGVPMANQELYRTDAAYRDLWDRSLAEHQKSFGSGYTAESNADVLRRGFTDALGVRQAPQGGDFGSLLDNFTGEDLQNEPGYQFGLNQGMNALDRKMNAGGAYFSGAALKAAQRFGQDYAGTKFGDAFNRDAANKTRIYNFLSGGASLGQNAAAQTGNAGMNMAQQVGANTTALGNAMGASRIAQGNAWSGAVNNVNQAYQQNELMNKILGGNSGWGGGYKVPNYPGAEY